MSDTSFIMLVYNEGISRKSVMDNAVSVPFNLPNTKVIKSQVNEQGHLIIFIETTESGVDCHRCGKHITTFHALDREIKLRHLSMLEYTTYIVDQPRRYICDECDHHPTTTATPSWYRANSPHTHVYEQHVLLSLVNSTLSDVAIRETLTKEAVQGIVDRHIETGVNWNHIDFIGVLGMDEIALKKGYKHYVTLITARHKGEICLLAVLDRRKKSTVKGFLKRIPSQLKKTVQAICVDMYSRYVNAAKEVFKKKTIIVVDRFHVAKLYRGELDQYRQKILKQLKQELSAAEYKKLKGAMHILRRNNECLTKEEKVILDTLFSHAPTLSEAYCLAIKLTQIFNTPLSKQKALIKIEAWIREVKKSKVPCFKTFIKTLKKYKQEITNYFIDRNSSGFVEGMNNKVKVLKRRCYGIFNLKHFFRRLHLDISGYRILLGNSSC